MDMNVEPQVLTTELQTLSLSEFHKISGRLGGFSFVKVVVDRIESKIYFLSSKDYKFHADFIVKKLLKMSQLDLEQNIDRLNKSFYFDSDRRFYLGIISLHQRQNSQFFSLETVEVDTMNEEMIQYFFNFVRSRIDASLDLIFKPASHSQESILRNIHPTLVPRIHLHELFAASIFVSLNPGKSIGRIRSFQNDEQYRRSRSTIEWHDIIVMNRVPDDIPKISGIINSIHTTPLSHTNVLATGWKIPNCIQVGILTRIQNENLDGKWVEYSVSIEASEIGLKEIEKPNGIEQDSPQRARVQVRLEEPETSLTKIMKLDDLRMSDQYKFGTKAANLGELCHVLKHGSDRLTCFYRIPRPPRADLLPYLATLLKASERADLNEAGHFFLRNLIQIPRGIAIPFSLQKEFLDSSPKIQQAIGKLKMAIELKVKDLDELCSSIQLLIGHTRMPDKMRNYIDSEVAKNLAGVSSFVVRSSSNAEDLSYFSAAGVYESIKKVITAETIFDSIKKVWASLLSARSVKLREDVGIATDDSYMGVIIQEEVKSDMGGVLVTTNPTNPQDFRNVYLNVSTTSVSSVVQGSELAQQYLYNTVEGGGRTVSLGSATHELSDEQKALLQNLTLAGRLLQSHFSPDYTFNSPVDIEWIAGHGKVNILQLRPYLR